MYTYICIHINIHTCKHVSLSVLSDEELLRSVLRWAESKGLREVWVQTLVSDHRHTTLNAYLGFSPKAVVRDALLRPHGNLHALVWAAPVREADRKQPGEDLPGELHGFGQQLMV